MRASAIGRGVLLVVAASGLIASCDRNVDGDGSRQTGVLVVAIRDVVAEQSQTDPDLLPVVYVVGGGEHAVAAAVQADVAAALHDEIDVRFADEREEAIQSDEVDQPVPDSGVLLVVDDIPETGDPIDVPIEIYRSEQDDATVVFTFAERTSSWVVTATSLVSRDA